MKDLFYRIVGRVSNVLDLVRPLMVRLLGGKRRSDGHDKTGLVQGGRLVVLERFPGDVCLVRYGSLAHTLWRAQELTLIDRHRKYFEKPLADFGCGDGSFGAALFSKIDFGIDNDPEALTSCARQKAYENRILGSETKIPLPSGFLGSVVANSVLEHTRQPEASLAEISRLLRPGGFFVMTVPLLGFSRHLARYFGMTQSRKVNREYHHYTLVEAETWIQWLALAGFDVVVVRLYQGPTFTFWYRMLRLVGERGLGIIPSLQERIWQWASSKIVDRVRASVKGDKDGANLFVVARRK